MAKERGKWNNIFQLVSLSRRLPKNHSSYERVHLDLRRMRRGMRGEKEVLFPLRFIKKDSHQLLHNLRIPDQNGAFEIDTLLLTPHYILILEIKNWYGTIIFGENGQVIRVGDDGMEEGFPNPLHQVKLQRHRLRQWLQSRSIPEIPIMYFVVISYPSTIIKSISPDHPIPEKVIHNNELFFKIQTLDRQFTKLKMDRVQLEHCTHVLNQAQTSFKRDIWATYNINKNALVTGVFCPFCSNGGMVRHLQKWYCNACGTFSYNAHIAALNDYKVLISDFISNREARRFLHIQSPYVAKHILQTGGYEKQGKTSHTRYRLEIKDEIS